MPGGNDTAYPEDFTFGLSKFVEPDITTDVVNCSTALYSQHGSSSLMVPTQDKPTVMASQLQQEMAEGERVEERHSSPFPSDETGLMSRNHLDEFKAEAAEEIERTFDIPTTVRDDEMETQEGDEREEPAVGIQTGEDELHSDEEAQAASSSEEDPACVSQNEEAGSQMENEGKSEGEQESPEDPSPDSQAEDEHNESPGEEDEEQTSQCADERISRQGHCSEGGVMPVEEARGESADVSERGKAGKDMSYILFPGVIAHLCPCFNGIRCSMKTKCYLSKSSTNLLTCLCFAAGWPDGRYNTFEAGSSQNVDSGRPTPGAPDEDESLAPEQRHLSLAEANENSSHPLYDDTGAEDDAPAEESAAEESATEESVEEIEEGDDSEDDEGSSHSFSMSALKF